ncbi:hypothetical protein SEPCBS119000_001614 [Sporothrix epigloea]|uniref:Uncharacterized protein n=1 Tax=Sporothrix epigloea TaxID=1892477 RepID=A0ABP0DFJ8_9PEZI
MTPPSLFRVSGRALIGILKVASSTLAGGAVETLAPIVFGTILIVTTATALVLYGIGHVGVASLTESGVFGLTKDAVDTLLGLVRMQWRFVRQLRWSWWLNTAARYEQRYEDHVLGAGSAHHGTSIVQDTVYPIHTFHDRDIHTCNNAASNCFLPWSHRPGNGHVGVANGHQDAEDSGVEASNQESQPGSHIRLDKRRDWVRWFFGLPRMTTIDDPQQPLAPLTSAAVEIARGLLEQQDMMQPGTDGLIPGDKAAEDLIEQRRRPRQANAKSGSRTHVFVNDRGAGHFDSGSSYNARTWLDETVVSDGDTAFSRYGPNPRGSLPTVGTSDAPSRFDMNGSGTDNYHW